MPWDGKKLPDALAVGATAAANAAANGAKNAAYLTYLQGQIGSNYVLKLVRDDVVVWQATASGSLPVSGSRFVLPTSVTQNSIAAADIDSGQWVLRTEHATDGATKYIATGVTPTGGIGPFLLSDDLATDGSVSLGSLLLNSPSFDTVASLTASDPRRFVWVDPNDTFANTPLLAGAGAATTISPYLQFNENPLYKVPNTLRTLVEPGIPAESRAGQTAPPGEYTFERVANPDNPLRMAHMHRIDSRYLEWGGTMRSQYWAPSLLDATTYWAAFSFRPGTDMGSATPTAPGEGLNIWDVHTSGGSYGRQPIEVFWANGNSLRLEHFGQYTVGQPQVRTISWTSSSLAVNTWYHLIMRFRVTKTMADGPLIQAWFAVGNGGLTQVVNRSDIMMGFHDMNTNQCYPKLGLYRWVFDVRRTSHYTGMYVFRENPLDATTLNENTLYALLLSKQ